MHGLLLTETTTAVRRTAGYVAGGFAGGKWGLGHHGGTTWRALVFQSLALPGCHGLNTHFCLWARIHMSLELSLIHI